MGIDVWVLRGSNQHEVAKEVVQEVVQEVAQEGAQDVSANMVSLVDSGVPEPGFHLCFLNYHSFGICLALGDNEEVVSMGSKRFCDDVALALAGGTRQPGVNNLKWPARGSEDTSIAAAQAIVTQRFMGLPGTVLVFGKDIVAYISGIEAGDDEVMNLSGRQIIVLDSIDEICSGVTGKRTLWQRLQPIKNQFSGSAKGSQA